MFQGLEEFGKSIFLSVFSHYIENKNKKVLILDVCIENSNISFITEERYDRKIKKISKNVFYIFYENINFTNNYIEKLLKELEENYDYILIDTNFENNNFLFNKLTNICDIILFLIEPNLLEFKKSKKILEILENDFEISKEKIKIIFNKVNKFQISPDILEDVFEEYEILEYINYNEEYTLYINRNTSYKIKDKSYEIIYQKIFK